MTWRFPKNAPSTGGIPDVEDVNESLTDMIDEMEGSLNEHNIADGAFTLQFLDNAAQYQLASVYTDANGVDPYGTAPAGTKYVQLCDTWVPVKSMDFASRGSAVWILGSAQLTVWETTFGVMVGIRVDGTVIAESILGSGEPDNNPLVAGAYGINSNTYGIERKACPAVVESIELLSPGQHTIELVVNQIRLGSTASFTTPRVFDRELILVELEDF